MQYKKRLIIALIFYPLLSFGQISKLPNEERSSAYFKLLLKRFIDTMDLSHKSQIVEEVSTALIDPKPSIRERFANKLIIVKREEFNQESIRIIERAFKSDELVNFHTIILAGQLELKEAQKGMYRFIQRDSSGQLNRKFGYKSNEWAAHLALARMGVQEHIDFVLSVVNNEPYSSTLFFELLDHLAYVRQKESINLIVEKLFSDEGYGYTPFEEPLKEATGAFALRTLPMLATLIKDIPLRISSAYNMKDLRAARAWFTENDRKFELKEGSNYIPRF